MSFLLQHLEGLLSVDWKTLAVIARALTSMVLYSNT